MPSARRSICRGGEQLVGRRRKSNVIHPAVMPLQPSFLRGLNIPQPQFGLAGDGHHPLAVRGKSFADDLRPWGADALQLTGSEVPSIQEIVLPIREQYIGSTRSE